jgi:pimeloyl-ACP methyl ester carboxylesterase
MQLELVSIKTDTLPLDGLFYQPPGGATRGAVMFMHGNCNNFYTGVMRLIPPALVKRGYACLVYNRRGHDVLVTVSRAATGGAFQLVADAIEDNRIAARWLAERGFATPIVVGHSNGGMLGVRHVADHPETPALVLLSAHCGGKRLMPTASAAGLFGGDRYEEFLTRARELVAAGKGSELMLMPGWYYLISAATFVDQVDNLPDIVALAPQVKCPVLYFRGDREPQALYPAEEFAAHAGGACEVRIVPDCDHFYGGHEDEVGDSIAAFLAQLPANAATPVRAATQS